MPVEGAKKMVCHYTCNKQTVPMDQPIHGKICSPEQLLKPHSECEETISAVREVILAPRLMTAQGQSCSTRSSDSSEWSFSVNYVRLGTEDSGGHPWNPIGGRSRSIYSEAVFELNIWRHWLAWKGHFENRQFWWFYYTTWFCYLQIHLLRPVTLKTCPWFQWWRPHCMFCIWAFHWCS